MRQKDEWQGWVPPILVGDGQDHTGQCSWTPTGHSVCEVTEVMEAGWGTHHHHHLIRSTGQLGKP